MASRIRIVVALFIAVVHLAALVAFAPIAGLPLDDAWIHQVVARTFAETGTLGYASGQHGAATTSQLWALLLAFDHRWLGIDPVRWAFVLNAAASLASSQLLHALLCRRTPENANSNNSSQWVIASAFATLLACISGNVLWFAHSGMETCLFVALSLAAIVLVTRRSLDAKYAIAGGFAAGLVALTRPEAIPLGALLVAYVVVSRRDRRGALLVALPWAIGVALYLGFNVGLTGVALPATRAGRSWLWFSSSSSASGTSGAEASLALASSFFETWGSRLSRYTFATRSFGLWIGIGTAAYGMVRLLKLRNDGIKLLFVWAIMHVGVYVVLLPTPGHGGRYQPFLPMLYAMSVAIGTILLVADLAYRLGKTNAIVVRSVVAIGCFAALPWAFFAMPAWRESSSAHVLAVDHIRDTEIETGRWIDASLPSDARIASFDIGGIGFASRRPILDIGGLSDEATANRLGDGSVWELLAAREVTHVVLPASYSAEQHRPGDQLDFGSRLNLIDNPAVVLEPIHTAETSRERWLPAVAATWNAAPRQIVYRVTYTGHAGSPLRASHPHRSPATMTMTPRSFAWGFPLALFVLFIGVWLHLLVRVPAGNTAWAWPWAAQRKARRSLQPQP